MACAPNSLNALWTVTADSGITHEQDPTPLKLSDVLEFVEPLLSHLQNWSQLFTQVPDDHQRRKDALGGALKIKAAIKQLEKVRTSLAESASNVETNGSTDDASDGQLASGSCEATSTLAESLQDCRTAWRDAVFGMLEVSFPVDELLSANDFQDATAHAASLQRMQLAMDLTSALGRLLARGKVVVKPMPRGPQEPLAPEVLKVLEKSIKKQKKKDKQKKGNASGSANASNFNAAKSTWEQTEGQCSCILGEELWEGLSWRRGLNLFCYIKFLLDEETPGEDEDKECKGEAQVTEPRPPPTQELFSDAMRSFYMMLIAQGPILANSDDPALWQATSDGPYEDETARMYYQGIYSSMHLRGLKHLAELGYWRWKHSGMKEDDAKLAALINKKFAHVVMHIMPHAGWTAQVEYERILEIEKCTLGASSEFSNGLGSKPDGSNSKSKPKVVVVPGESKGKSGAAGDDSAKKNATGAAVSSTAPV